MATAQKQIAAQEFGILPASLNNSNTTFAMSAAANWLAYGFVLAEAKTLSKVKVFASAVGGTFTAASQSCDIYSDTAGTGPNASLASRTTYTPDPITAGVWVEFTGFALSLSANTQYWIVLKNNNATPATNFPTYRFYNGGLNPFFDSATTWGWSKKQSTDSGATWATSPLAEICGFRLEFSDATFAGVPTSSFGTVGSTSRVFAKQEIGNVFTVPASWPTINIRGVAGGVTKVGTPSQGLQFRLYNGTTLLGTTGVVPVASVTSNAYVVGYFTSTIAVAPGTTLRIVYSEPTQVDTSANCWAPLSFTIENDANSKALMPWGAKQTATTDSSAGPPVFTDTDTVVIPIGVVFDTDGEFTVAASGVKVASGMLGGIRG